MMGSFDLSLSCSCFSSHPISLSSPIPLFSCSHCSIFSPHLLISVLSWILSSQIELFEVSFSISMCWISLYYSATPNTLLFHFITSSYIILCRLWYLIYLLRVFCSPILSTTLASFLTSNCFQIDVEDALHYYQSLYSDLFSKSSPARVDSLVLFMFFTHVL